MRALLVPCPGCTLPHMEKERNEPVRARYTQRNSQMGYEHGVLTFLLRFVLSEPSLGSY